MIEGLFSVVPVEMKPMSIISLILIMVLAGVIRANMSSTKALKEELKETKKELDCAKDHLNDQIKELVLSLKVDVTEVKGSIKSVSSCLSNMKTDIRELRNNNNK